ncbi:hypothetical protein JCM17960_05390 [Magnetospira thiophila]
MAGIVAGQHLLAEQLVGVVTPLEAEQVFLEVRAVLWMADFAGIPESMFARQLQAHDERNREGFSIQ